MTTAPMHTDSPASARPRLAWLFPAIVLSLLGLNITIVTITVTAARRSEPAGERDLRVLERAAEQAKARRDATKVGNALQLTDPPRRAE
jgi:hypothetical protein